MQAQDFARARGGRFSLRIEDIDGTRSRPEHVDAILRDLEWLGLEWDGPVLFQSQRLALYGQALDRLRGLGLLYPCFCTRADIAASLSAPHGPEGVYPGICRGLAEPDLSRPHSWRLDMERALTWIGAAPPAARAPLPLAGGVGGGNETIPRALSVIPSPSPSRKRKGGEEGRLSEELTFHDPATGTIPADPRQHGDVILARKDAPASYHLAVTVDDAAQGITHVVRGVDLFAATHVHRLLQALLGLPTPDYRHHPLLLGPDGTRLAKRHGAPSLEAMRLGGEDGRALAERLRSGQLPVGIGAGQA
ncbi:glutamyl-tRNA synthetase [Sphingomonas hengshuiensis]|uniref:Glutamyl-tRNA synthetase n=1 Tax=Sphingomonas hengshuiensis TaxID=1609977 RepID=A0A7U5BG32_9SPHN|nr:glutamyl-tRNA synthetase [Sphingomonas hengshuiensis]